MTFSKEMGDIIEQGLKQAQALVKKQTNIKKEQVLLSKYIFVGHIDEFLKIVKATGYPYFEWNDRVYKVKNDTYEPTDVYINEIK